MAAIAVLSAQELLRDHILLCCDAVTTFRLLAAWRRLREELTHLRSIRIDCPSGLGEGLKLRCDWLACGLSALVGLQHMSLRAVLSTLKGSRDLACAVARQRNLLSLSVDLACVSVGMAGGSAAMTAWIDAINALDSLQDLDIRLAYHGVKPKAALEFARQLSQWQQLRQLAVRLDGNPILDEVPVVLVQQAAGLPNLNKLHLDLASCSITSQPGACDLSDAISGPLARALARGGKLKDVQIDLRGNSLDRCSRTRLNAACLSLEMRGCQASLLS
mmetsp:Transcript_31389/g.57638  ORF Transcript_31389/g.57638 Transcript_31389/m.57638 type:complete len:275 (-) Transcript_31389:55-879(-)